MMEKASRSRRGCIDCKKAKVKCDEVQPRCGTCYRRGYVCQGYIKSNDTKGPKVPNLTPCTKKLIVRPTSTPEDAESSSVATECTASSILTTSGIEYPARRRSSTNDEEESTVLWLNSVSALPPGTISNYDGSIIGIYFSRHPTESVISSEFIEEMNSNVLKVFYNDPQAVCDPLSAIGHIYVGNDSKSSIVPVLNRKARILRRLREMSGERNDLEKSVVLLLGLCALELIDGESRPGDTVLPALIANTAFTINYYISGGNIPTSIAKYFIRAIARQDIIISLTYSRRSLIAVDTWLDEECAKRPDRFMGYTATMMPILSDLSALAEDMKQERLGNFIAPPSPTASSVESTLMCFPSGYSIQQRAVDLRNRIREWSPISNPQSSFQSSKIFLFHGRSFQAAALLYLYRLLNPPGSSNVADDTAVSMAHDVLMYISGTPAELKLSLWPVFISATELVSEEDRNTALQTFDMIHAKRGTVTSKRTRDFTIERVWKARDAGVDWNWMVLANQYPGECMPI